MSQLTKTAQKTYAGLVCGNLIILFSLLMLGQYFYTMDLKPLVPPANLRALGKVVHLLKEKSESNWPQVIAKQTIPWTKMTLSTTAIYQENTFLGFQPLIVFDLLKHNKKLEFSVLIKEGNWLNIKMLPPIPDQYGLWLTVISLCLILLIALFLVNYWAVKALNSPVQTLIQSLKYSEDQAAWSPIPVTGNSDQKLIFEKINLLQEKVNQLLYNRTQVVTAISHDLRTPLTRLKLRAEYLVDNPNFDKIMQDINEMETMIRETLDYFSDVNHDEKMQRFDLIAMVNSLVADAIDLNFEVSFSSDRDKLIYFGHVNLLKRAFSNLINNAVYYGKHAVIQLRQLRDQIEISIEDSGPGLKEDDLERVFIPFYRGEGSRSRETGGTGLGLTIAKEIIQKHRGTITLSNRTQGGLHVLITLPVALMNAGDKGSCN